MRAGMRLITDKLNVVEHHMETGGMQPRQSKISASPSDHGQAIHDSLQLSGCIDFLAEDEGRPIVAGDVVATAREWYLESSGQRPKEKFLVNLYTPSLTEVIELVDPLLRLVNSEYIKWLRCSSGHIEYDMMPDLFSAYYPLVLYGAPYRGAPESEKPRLFGGFEGWGCRSSIHCIFDAKWKITMDGFGAICKYLQITGEDCVDYNGVAVRLKGVLFDFEELWMVQSSGNTIVRVDKCRIDQAGSREKLVNFLRVTDPWMEASNSLCALLEESIVDYSRATSKISWLGSGANGRVFALNSGRVLKIVVGKRSDDVETEYELMISHLSQAALSPVVFPVVEGSYRDGTVWDGGGHVSAVKFAGYMLAEQGVPLKIPLTSELKNKVAVALYTLHANKVIHGDPRIDNVLLLDGEVKWIDFRESFTVTSKVSIRRDVTTLFQSLGGQVLAVDLCVEAYVNGPSAERLCEVVNRI